MSDLLISALVSFFGVLLLVSGVFTIVLRRRIAANIARSSGGARNSEHAPFSTVVAGLAQFGCGAGFLFAGLSRSESLDRVALGFRELAGYLGSRGIYVALVAAFIGGVLVVTGALLFRRAWSHRHQWTAMSGDVDIAKGDQALIIGATVIVVVGAVSIVASIVLLLAVQ